MAWLLAESFTEVFTKEAQESHLPKPEALLLGNKAFLLGLFSNERFASEISAVTRVIIILKDEDANIKTKGFM